MGVSDSTQTTQRNQSLDMEDDMQDDAIARTQSTTLDDRDKYAPGDFQELMKFSKVVAQSNLCPDHVKGPEDVVMIVQQGQELGLSPMQALQGLHVIRGKVGLGADTMKAICESSGQVERWDYPTLNDTEVEVVVQRAGREPYRTTWSKSRAEKAGLWSSDTYQSYPTEMLRHRADAEAARAVFPDLLLGLYTPQELRSIDKGGRGEGSRKQPQRDTEDDTDTLNAEIVDNGDDDPFPVDGLPQRDFSSNVDQSNEHWSAAIDQITELTSSMDIDGVSELMARQHGVQSVKQIPTEVLGEWVDLLGGDPKTVRAATEKL